MISGELPSFATPFDGSESRPEVSPDEQRLVAAEFGELYDSLLEKWDYRHTISHRTVIDPGHLLIVLKVPVDEKQHWRATIDQDSDAFFSDYPNAEKPSFRSIVLDKMVDGNIRRVIDYRHNADGIVRRLDHGDPYLQWLQRKLTDDPITQNLAHRSDSPVEEWRQSRRYLSLTFDAISNAISNQRLEADLGINDQPIGMEEMRGLSQMLTGPDVSER